ncbi:hypothetical protein NC651_012667 [Populus alba x Populus x berolinensis]|nr:hypothetical protein NC651_012667 [Populus alba x Populus x berolinensis]
MEKNTDLGRAPSVALQNQTVPRTVIGVNGFPIATPYAVLNCLVMPTQTLQLVTLLGLRVGLYCERNFPVTRKKAAKEFESELKKEPDSTSDTPGEQPTTISEEKKHDIEVSSSKESV